MPVSSYSMQQIISADQAKLARSHELVEHMLSLPSLWGVCCGWAPPLLDIVLGGMM